MKLKYILPVLCLPMLAACSNGDSGSKSIADYKNASQADSLVYYFGQMRAAEFWREAQADTTLATRQARDEFLKGIRAGMDAVRDKEAYNQGVYIGMQMAMNMQELEQAYGIKPDKNILIDAIAGGLANDSVVDYNDASNHFSQIMYELNAQKEAKDKQMGQQALADEAKALKMTKVNDDLYAATPTKPGSGPQIQLGDSVAVVMTVTKVGGEEIDRQATPLLKVGTKHVGPITEALLTMHVGETREFLTTPPALMGRVYARRGMQPNDLLKIIITTNPVK